MKFIALLFLTNCAAVAASQPASKPVESKPVEEKATKFFVGFLNPENPSEEGDCVFLDYKENEKLRHFLFNCNGALIHVGLRK